MGADGATGDREAARSPQTVDMTAAGIADEVMGAVPAQLDAYHWHAISFEAPDSGTLLAESETNQEVFRIGSPWGIQYHPCLDLPRWRSGSSSRARRSRRRA